MAWWITLWVILGVLLVWAAFALWQLAYRVDRLHRRINDTEAALSRNLVRRASDSLKLADSGLLTVDDSSLLRRSAQDAIDGAGLAVAATAGDQDLEGATEGPNERYLLESGLSRALRQVLTVQVRNSLNEDPLGAVLLRSLDDSAYRVRVNRSLYNQNVSLVRDLRGRWAVSAFHLAGHASLPGYVDLDDAA